MTKNEPTSLHSRPVVFMAPEASTFDAMVSAWERQQLSRGLREVTIARNSSVTKRFQAYTGDWPWNWVPGDVEDFTSHLLSGSSPLARSTIRGYHWSLRAFCSFITDPAYQWPAICDERFGTAPVQVFHDWNTQLHASEFEARPARRPFTYSELERFFGALDQHVERIVAAGKKGALSALRDATFFKTVYAFGLRRTEARMLDIVDLHVNAEQPTWGEYGLLQVRFGKASRGGAQRRRGVLAVPEFEWAITGLKQWVEQARPLYGALETDAIWVTERKGRVSNRYLDTSFAVAREQADLDPALTLHSLRHSYVTHLIEYGYPERFVQEQVGHSYSSTTAIYTSVSNDYKNRILAKALARVYERDQE